MLRDRPAPKTGAQMRDQAIDDLTDAMHHLNRAVTHTLALSARAQEMSPARHARERISAQIERLRNQTSNRRNDIQNAA